MSWRAIFAAFCLLYTAWVVFLGLGNFAKVHGEYRRVRESQQPTRIERIALQELVGECRRAEERAGRGGANDVPIAAEEDCRSFPPPVLEARKKNIAVNLQAEEKRFLRKLVVFYAGFGLFFVVLPLGLLYLLLSFLVWLFKDMKFVK